MNSKSFVTLLLMVSAVFSQAFVVVSPNGGENYTAGQKVSITWTPSNQISTVALQYSIDNGASWFSIADRVPCAPGSYGWIAPFFKKQTTQALVRVTADNVANPPTDVSDAPFTIQAAAPDVYEPNNDTTHAYSIALGDSAVKNAVVSGGDSSMTDTSNNDVDFFRLTLTAGKLLTVLPFPCFSSDSIGFGVCSPCVELLNASSNSVASGYYGSFTYNVTQAGTYYLKVWTPPGSWSKYGLSVKAVTILAMQTTGVDSAQMSKVTDSSGTKYTVAITNDTTRLNLTLTLSSKIGGSVTTAVLSTTDLASAPGTAANVKAISITADAAITSSIKSADITIPYSAADLNGAPESSLVVLWLNDSTSQWSPISFSVDTVNHVITAHTTHFSVYGVFAGSASTHSIVRARIPSAFGMKAAFLRTTQCVTVCYSLPVPGNVDIRLYNARGICLKRKTMISAAAGYEMMQWDCRDLGAGLHIVDFRAGTYHTRAKIAVVR